MVRRYLPHIALFVSRGRQSAEHSNLARRTLWIGQTLFILLVCCAAALAEDSGKPLKLDKETSRYNLKGHLGLYEDKTGAETLDSVQTKTFFPTEQAAPNLAYTRSAYWIKLVVQNVTQQPETVRFQISNHYLDFIDIFIKSDRKSHVEHYRAGARVPFDEWFSQESRPALDLHFAPYERKTIFVRAQSATPLRIPLALSAPEAHALERTKNLFLLGVFYGVMVFVIIYNLFS